MVAKPKPKAPKKLNGVSLMGVYGAGDGLGLIATIDGVFSRISKGQSVKGWQFSAYEDGAAVFVSGGKKSVLPLELTAPSVKVVSVPKASDAAAGKAAVSRRWRWPLFWRCIGCASPQRANQI